MTGTIELPRMKDPGSGLDDNWRVIVLNDNHNTFEGVAFALSSTLPGVSYDQGMAMANTIHSKGQAIVWTGSARARRALLGAAQGVGADDGAVGAGLGASPGATGSTASPEPRISQKVGSSGTW